MIPNYLSQEEIDSLLSAVCGKEDVVDAEKREKYEKEVRDNKIMYRFMMNRLKLFPDDIKSQIFTQEEVEILISMILKEKAK